MVVSGEIANSSIWTSPDGTKDLGAYRTTSNSTFWIIENVLFWN